MASSNNDPIPNAVAQTDPDGLANPNTVADVLKKHGELKTAETVKRGRGRPRNDGKPAGSGKPAAASGTGGDVPADLFTADSIRPFVELPFGVGNVWLKTDSFTLDRYESDTLSRQGALVANLYAPGWNPKAVALTAFALGFASIATKKMMVYLGELAEKKKKAAEQGGK